MQYITIVVLPISTQTSILKYKDKIVIDFCKKNCFLDIFEKYNYYKLKKKKYIIYYAIDRNNNIYFEIN